MSITLDPREVLQTLNGMGYRNISAEQLKEFIRDLKRFIIYENRYSNIEDVFQKVMTERSKPKQKSTEPPKATRNHPAVVPSSQKESVVNRVSPAQQLPARVLRVKDQNNQTSFTNPPLAPPPPTTRNPSEERLFNAYENNRRCLIPIPPTISPEPSAPPSARSRSTGTATTATRRKSQLIRNTPTDLFLFYQRDWERFRNLLPGENSRSSVRAEVRRRMEHQPPPKPKVYLRFGEDQRKTMTTRLGRREM